MNAINGKQIEWEDELERTTSIRFVDVGLKDGIRHYEGLSKDVPYLPKEPELETGSTCFMIDTSEVYKYECTTQDWYLL